MNTRQIIKSARAAYTRIRKEWNRLRDYRELQRAIREGRVRMGIVEQSSPSDQHRISCLTAYEAKRDLVKHGKGRNTLEGMPA